MATKFHYSADYSSRRCVATKRNGNNCSGCMKPVIDHETGNAVPTEHIEGILQLAKNGGNTVIRSSGKGTYRETYIYEVNDHIVEIGERVRVRAPNGDYLNYRERGQAFGFGKDIPVPFKLEDHSIPLHSRATNEPLAWEVHKELATILAMGEAQWTRTPEVERRALMSNAFNRYVSTFASTSFSGHTSEFTHYGRTVARLKSGETVHTLPEGLAQEKPETVVRHIVKQLASQRSGPQHRFDKDFKFHFGRFLNDQGLAAHAGVTESSQDEAKAKAFDARRMNRMKWHAFCDNGHETHSISKPVSPRICMTCVEDGDETPKELIFKQKVGV